MGRIETSEYKDPSSIGNLNNLMEVLHLSPVKEIIFCEGQLSFKTILETIPHIPRHVKIKYFAKGSHTIIGSDDKDVAGEFISGAEEYRLANAVHRRAKKLLDVIVSLVFLFSFPIHFFIKKNPVLFFENIFKVISGKKTWVGYAIQEKYLPSLNPGIITTTGLPFAKNSIPDQSLLTIDTLYAKHYNMWQDFKLVFNNYRFYPNTNFF